MEIYKFVNVSNKSLSKILYHFELFGVARVTGPFDGAKIGV